MTTLLAVPEVDRSPPPYQQIAAHYRERMRRGELTEGDLLPPVRKIMAEWNVATKTAQRALAVLKEEGLIQTRPAKPPLIVRLPE